MKLTQYPWNHLALTLSFSTSVALCYLFIPDSPRGVLIKVTVTLMLMGWLLFVIAIGFLMHRHRSEMAILAAQNRFVDVFIKGTPYSLHHPRNDQETRDLKVLQRARRHKRTRRLLHRSMIEWLELIQTVNPL